nr:hypothetical protein CFP56_79692 [Quercus suber]
MKPRTLSREEEAKLAHSNKKVKDIHHVEFNGAVKEGSPPIDNLRLDHQTRASFKDKLIGEIPGAFVEAFDLTDQLEEDTKAEEEIVDNNDLVGPGVKARFGGLGRDQGFDEKLISSLHKEASLIGELRHLDCSKAHGSNSRPLTLLRKTIPHSVKGKKAFARNLNLSPITTSAAGRKLKGILTHLSFTPPKLAHSILNETS